MLLALTSINISIYFYFTIHSNIIFTAYVYRYICTTVTFSLYEIMRFSYSVLHFLQVDTCNAMVGTWFLSTVVIL